VAVTDGASLTDACRQAGIYAGRMQEHFRVDPISACNVRFADEQNLNNLITLDGQFTDWPASDSLMTTYIGRFQCSAVTAL
jgi:hypothetical protein